MNIAFENFKVSADVFEDFLAIKRQTFEDFVRFASGFKANLGSIDFLQEK